MWHEQPAIPARTETATTITLERISFFAINALSPIVFGCMVHTQRPPGDTGSTQLISGFRLGKLYRFCNLRRMTCQGFAIFFGLRRRQSVAMA
ncbi:MAG: hypothetical protein CMJ68_04260 [Planctomycetaceae bacterium]|nr:hypothetical protein [Planctomycetaceae bacterium]